MGTDVTGVCDARLIVGDDYGDNTCTFRCQHETGHDGRHREEFFDGKAVVEWDEGAS